MAAILALLVPAPIKPKETTAAIATSESASWLSLLNVSIALTFGFDMQRRSRAKGTAFRMLCCPYCRRCSNERIAILSPNSSALAIIAIPRTAGPWYLSMWANPESTSHSEIIRSYSSANLSMLLLEKPMIFWWFDGRHQLILTKPRIYKCINKCVSQVQSY